MMIRLVSILHGIQDTFSVKMSLNIKAGRSFIVVCAFVGYEYYFSGYEFFFNLDVFYGSFGYEFHWWLQMTCARMSSRMIRLN